MSQPPGAGVGQDGLVIVDKPAGWTSHDVVARVRRLAGTRRVGHAGTLDPMATGVLVMGVGRGTRLLTYLVGMDKAYAATIRLGAATVTDDAEGEVTARQDASGVGEPEIRGGLGGLVGELMQVPCAVSAIKIGGERAYARVRAGQDVALPPRPVTVHLLDLLALRRTEDSGLPVIDLDVAVECSSGTYVRALARDLGAALGVGGHVIALRRTRVGPYPLDLAHDLDDLSRQFCLLPLADAVRAALPTWSLDADRATRLAHGQRLLAPALVRDAGGPVAAFDPDGRLVALVVGDGPNARPVLVLGGGRDPSE